MSRLFVLSHSRLGAILQHGIIKALGVTLAIVASLCVDNLFGSVAWADDSGSIFISPTKLYLSINPGETVTDSFIVKNESSTPEILRPVATPYSVTGEDYTPDYDTEGSYAQIHNWVTFAQDEYQLRPGDETRVEYTVTAPEDIPAGGQYAAILVSSAEDNSSSDGLAVKNVLRPT